MAWRVREGAAAWAGICIMINLARDIDRFSFRPSGKARDDDSRAARTFDFESYISLGRLEIQAAGPQASGDSVDLRPIDGGAIGGSTRYSAEGALLNQFVTPVNDAPTSTNLQGDTVTWTEHDGSTLLDLGSDATIADVDTTDFSGGRLTVEITAGLVAAEDQLVIDTSGSVSITFGLVFVNGTPVATMIGGGGGGAGGGPLVFLFDPEGGATAGNIQTLIRAIGYTNSGGEAPTDGDRTVTWTLIDGDGQANGGADTLTVTTTVDVDPVNDAPAGADKLDVAIDEDETYTFFETDFGFSDGAEGDDLAAVIVTSLPGDGRLLLAGAAVSAGQAVGAQDIADGKLVFTPGLNGSGDDYADFTFQVRDDGGTADGGQDTDQSPNSFRFDVNAVNDAPTVSIAPGGAAFAKAGGELLVNTETLSIQNDPTITALASGGFVVSWRDASGQGGDASGDSIKAQIYDAAGVKVDGEFLVNTVTASNQQQPAIAALASGGFVVSWTDTSGDGDSFFGIKAQIFDAAGGKVGGEFLVNTVTFNLQTAPTITGLASGGFVVSWQTDISEFDSDLEIRAQLFDAAGGKVGGEFAVNTAASGAQQAPTIAALASGGFVVSWADASGEGGDASGGGIKAQLFDAAGAKVGGEFLVNTVTAGIQSAPTIVWLASGGFVASWNDSSGEGGDASGGGIKAQLFDAAGSKLGGELLVNTATFATQNQPTVTALSAGGFVVSWADNLDLDNSFNIDDVKAQVFDAAGNKVGGEFLVNTATDGSQNSPVITTLASGAIALSWSSRPDDLSPFDVNAQVFEPTAWQATEQVALDLKGGIAVADVDAGAGTISAILSVDYGVLDVDAGGSGATVADSGTGAVTITGTLAQVQALLATDATSIVSYTPDTDAPPGSADLTVTVDDGGASGAGGALTGSDVETIHIAAVDDAPTLDNAIADHNSDEDTAISYTVPADAFSDVDGDALTLGATLDDGSALPAWLSFDAATRTFSGTPPRDFNGTIALKVTASDGTASASDTFDLIVDAVNDAPTVSILPGGAAFAAAGGELLVNTETFGAQDQPTITALASGGFVVSWRDQSGQGGDASGSSIKAQIFDAAGDKVGGELLVNTVTTSAQFEPTIAALASGGFVASWTDGSGDGDPFLGIKAQIFNAAGARVGGEFLVNSVTSGPQTVPTITGLASGGFVVSWQTNIGEFDTDFEIKAQIFDAAGAKLGGEFLVNSATTGQQQAPTITALASGGFVVSWQDDSSGIKARIYDAAGAGLGGEFLVSTTTFGSQNNPTIAALASGGFVVSWADNSGQGGDASGSSVKAQIFDANGDKLGGEFLVNTATSGEQQQPTVTALPSGGFVVSWTDRPVLGGPPSLEDVKAQIFDAVGARVGGEFLVSTATADRQFEPTIAALASGGFVVSWTDRLGDANGFAVKAQVFEPTAYQATEQVALDLKGGIAVADVDAGAGLLTVTLSVDFGILHVEAGDSGAGVTGNDAASVEISGTPAQIQALLGGGGASIVTYTANSDDPPAGATLSVTVDDGGNSGDGGAKSGSGSAAITITSVNDAAVAANDAVSTDEATPIIGGDLFADNGSGADADPDGPALAITAVNGSALDVGNQIALASGALLTVNSDGAFDYDPNGAFDATPAASSGASNAAPTDSFSYEITGGATATVTVTVNGIDGDDLLLDTPGDDTIDAGIGRDTLMSGAGADDLDGGEGLDLVRYRFSDAGVTITLSGGAGSGGHAAGDLLSNIERAQGSIFADSITGDGADNRLNGQAGGDTLDGADGHDKLFGKGGADSLIGGMGDDQVRGGVGADTMEGGDGFDKLSYKSAATGIAVDLLAGTGSAGEAAGDMVSGFEQVIGSLFADTISGDGDANVLRGLDQGDMLSGGAGKDILLGDAGADTIDGGADADALSGGGGFDLFVFTDGFGRDRIVDFDAGDNEKIDLSAVTAITDFGDLTADHLRADSVTGWAEIFDGDDRILLVGYTVAQIGAGQVIDAADFVF